MKKPAAKPPPQPAKRPTTKEGRLIIREAHTERKRVRLFGKAEDVLIALRQHLRAERGVTPEGMTMMGHTVSLLALIGGRL